MKQYADFQQGGGGYCGWQWGVGDGKGGGELTNVVLHEKLEPYTKVQVYHTTMLSSQINLEYKQTKYIIS